MARFAERWLPSACILQLLGVSVATAASTIQIESIVVSGPLLSLLGLTIAVAAWALRRSTAAALFGLSVMILSAGVFGLIVSLPWSPDDAQYPVPLILIGYEYLITPFGAIAVHRLWRNESARADHRRLQFGLRDLLALTLVVAIASGVLRIAMNRHSLTVELAPGVAAAIVLAVLRRRMRKPSTLQRLNN